jgi:phosphoribosyl 1,2-cyclic phosphate phosphodiesterase
LKIQLLGTAAAEGWPGLFCRCGACDEARRLGGKNIRSRSSALIDDILKIDFPPDTLHHVFQHGLDLQKVEHLLFTHGHDDHFAVMELQYSSPMFLPAPLPKTLNVYAGREVAARLEQSLEMDRVPIRPHTLEYWKTVQAGPFQVTPIAARHDPDQTCFNFLIERDGKTLLYATDTGWYDNPTWEFLTRFKLEAIVIECTKGKIEGGYSGHLSASEVIRTKERLAADGALGPGATVVTTHHSHLGGLLHEELESVFNPHGIEVGFDGMTFEV